MLASVALHAAAQRWLRTLHTTVGRAGLSAAGAIPGLGAMLDQHAAAVRDATSIGLQASAGSVAVVLLASYGDGVYSYAREHGWRPLPAHPAAWRGADWTSLRLAAVCSLAAAYCRSGPAAATS